MSPKQNVSGNTRDGEGHVEVGVETTHLVCDQTTRDKQTPAFEGVVRPRRTSVVWGSTLNLV